MEVSDDDCVTSRGLWTAPSEDSWEEASSVLCDRMAENVPAESVTCDGEEEETCGDVEEEGGSDE